MNLTRRFLPWLTVAVLACASVAALGQSPAQAERVAASFVLALGRTPAAGEVDQWITQEPLPLADLVARHRRQLGDDAAAARAVVIKAGQDALGQAPTEDQVKDLSGGRSYVDLMQHHIRWLDGQPDEYTKVLHRAYRSVLARDAYSVEIDYWKRRPVLSFALLVGCIEDWARRNRPGLMATAGTPSVSVNSACLATVRLSPAVAAEARIAAGLALAPDRALALAAGRTIVAPGAELVTSVGGIAFVAAGAPGIVPAQETRSVAR